MVEDRSSSDLDAVFHALGDETRRRMLLSLGAGALSVGQLAAPFSMSLAAASKHVKALESAGLIRRQVRGRTHLLRLEPAPLAHAQDWIARTEGFWTQRLRRLDEALREDLEGSA